MNRHERRRAHPRVKGSKLHVEIGLTPVHTRGDTAQQLAEASRDSAAILEGIRRLVAGRNLFGVLNALAEAHGTMVATIAGTNPAALEVVVQIACAQTVDYSRAAFAHRQRLAE